MATTSATTPTATLAVGAFAIGADIHLVAGLVRPLSVDLGVTVGAAGLAATVFALATALGAPLLSVAVAARPARRVLVGSLALHGLLTAASALAPTLAVLLVLRGLAALACSVYVPTAAASAVAGAPAHRRGRLLGTLLLGSSLGAVVGAPVAALLAGLLSWRAAFGLVALVSAVALLGLLRARVGAGQPPPAPVRDRLRLAWRPGAPAVLAVTVLILAGSGAVFTYLGVLVDGPGRLALLVAVFGIAGVAGVRWGGAVVDRFGGYRVVLVTVVVLAAAFAVLPHAGPVAAVAAVAAWGALAWSSTLAQQHRLLAVDAGPPAVLLALNTSAVHLGFAAGALGGGLVADAGGQLWIFAVSCCGAAWALLLLRREPS